ncbi:DUF4194 domain-containing protein [Sphingomonas sp. 3-13AW]|uniref:DUF4194 domain-containing protein n=1 Tax=Sphingomonas sp. 3-13AW TaxID=3050450 RepID=UPI003BB55FC0
MLTDLFETLEARRNSGTGYEASDFSAAADRLLVQQCVFRDDWGCQKHYEIVARNVEYFTDLMAAVGRSLVVDERERMLTLVPLHPMARSVLQNDETILLLVLRSVFERGVSDFGQGDDGEVETTSDDVLDRYEPMSGRPRPVWSRAYEMLRAFDRRRFIRVTEPESGISSCKVVIRPAIRHLTGDDWMGRLEEWATSEKGAAQPGLLEGEEE